MSIHFSAYASSKAAIYTSLTDVNKLTDPNKTPKNVAEVDNLKARLGNLKQNIDFDINKIQKFYNNPGLTGKIYGKFQQFLDFITRSRPVSVGKSSIAAIDRELKYLDSLKETYKEYRTFQAEEARVRSVEEATAKTRKALNLKDQPEYPIDEIKKVFPQDHERFLNEILKNKWGVPFDANDILRKLKILGKDKEWILNKDDDVNFKFIERLSNPYIELDDDTIQKMIQFDGNKAKIVPEKE